MENVVLIIHILVAIALIGMVLLQKSEGSGFVGGGSGGGLGSFLTARSAGNILTKTTTILAVAFISLSIVLAILAGKHGKDTGYILDKVPVAASTAAPQANQVPVAK